MPHNGWCIHNVVLSCFISFQKKLASVRLWAYPLLKATIISMNIDFLIFEFYLYTSSTLLGSIFKK